MHFTVTHATRYTYNRPVYLEPHIVRLRPRSDGAQRLLRFDWRIEPHPAGCAEQLDAENNVVLNAWFGGQTESLTIFTTFEVETLRENPFGFLLDPASETVPLCYPLYRYPALAAYCQRRSSVHPGVTELAQGMAQEAGYESLAFLLTLNRWMHGNIGQVVREAGDPQPPGMTLESREGSCRDLAVLFMEVCRLQGIAARFVSGYQEGSPEQEMRHLHAWPEVYLPGAGWLGFDPTLGLAVADRHIAVAASIVPPGAAPVYGTFRQSDATATMDADIELTATASK